MTATKSAEDESGKPKKNVYVSNSFSPSSNFEKESLSVLRIYKEITGEDIDLENLPADEE